MELSNVEKKVIEIMEECIGHKVDDLNTPLIGTDCLIDSLIIVNMVFAVEQEFHISFEDDLELEYLNSFQAFLDAVNSRL